MPGIAYSFEKDAGHGGLYVERINNHQRYIVMKLTKVFIIPFWPFLTFIPAKGLEKERIFLLFNPGNVGMDMNGSYYRKQKKKIQKDGIKEKIPVGGIGGLSGQEVYILSEFPLQIGKTVIDVSNVNVFTDNVMHQMDDVVVDGNLGVRFIRACNKITVNFRKSFIRVE